MKTNRIHKSIFQWRNHGSIFKLEKHSTKYTTQHYPSMKHLCLSPQFHIITHARSTTVLPSDDNRRLHWVLTRPTAANVSVKFPPRDFFPRARYHCLMICLEYRICRVLTVGSKDGRPASLQDWLFCYVFGLSDKTKTRAYRNPTLFGFPVHFPSIWIKF